MLLPAGIPLVILVSSYKSTLISRVILLIVLANMGSQMEPTLLVHVKPVVIRMGLSVCLGYLVLNMTLILLSQAV
jgi:hypothetical protein